MTQEPTHLLVPLVSEPTASSQDQTDRIPANDLPEQDDLPYLHTYVSVADMQAAWHYLQQYHAPPRKTTPYTLRHTRIHPDYLHEYLVIFVERDLYYRVNFITDYFSEPSRLRARRWNQPLSPFAYWQEHKQRAPQNASAREKREWLYSQTIEVVGFRLTVAASVFDFFCPKTIFEPCAGHGNGAIAALSRDYVTEYQGCEPNTLAHKLISRAIKALCHPRLGKKAHVANVPFEDYKFEEGKTFDMVFVSPPYFNVEIYCEETTQSIVKHKDQQNGTTRF